MYQEHGASVSIGYRIPARKTPVVISLQFQQNNHQRDALSNFTGMHSLLKVTKIKVSCMRSPVGK